MPLPAPVETERASLSPREDPQSASLRLPLIRLLQLVMILQNGRYPNARKLAEACAVSRRTIYRDLAILESAGIRVDYHPDRQGYRLAGECFLHPLQLDEHEALILQLLSHLHPWTHPFVPVRLARCVVDKVIQTLPEGLRDRVTEVGDLFVGDPTSVDLPPDRKAIYETIWAAVRRRRKVRLAYREPPSGAVGTKFSIYRIAHIDSAWSVIGPSTWHREIHLVRIPGIQHVELTDETYGIPPRFRLERWLSRSHADSSAEVHLRFTSRVADMVRDAPGPSSRAYNPLADGDLDVLLHVPIREELVLWILGFGDQVEVLRPEHLRAAVRARAVRIARIHAGPECENSARRDTDTSSQPQGVACDTSPKPPAAP